jgi:hypothetical protein
MDRRMTVLIPGGRPMGPRALGEMPGRQLLSFRYREKNGDGDAEVVWLEEGRKDCR